MNRKEESIAEKHLTIFEDRSVYHRENGSIETFEEGPCSNAAKARIKRIKDKFESGFLNDVVDALDSGTDTVDTGQVSETAKRSLKGLVESLTSEVGRALIGLTVMQLCIKSIEPEQNIRLHKASTNGASFSWKEGVSMRTLDKKYVTPTLRRRGLVRLNADGFMMTRSLAENYPYSALYKAKLRGAREDWLSIVEELESRSTNPNESLKYIISLLLNAAGEFRGLADAAVDALERHSDKYKTMTQVLDLTNRHVHVSEYAARLLEVAMHALFQAGIEVGAFGAASLKPLSQMRSANKKHGNIGDIELMEGPDIIEAWDAKYGKSYLREEVEEVAEKIPEHDHVVKVGFVTNKKIENTHELDQRISEVEELHDVELLIKHYDEWVEDTFRQWENTDLVTEGELASRWARAYVESLAQKRREMAPIDEPCSEWLKSLITELGK